MKRDYLVFKGKIINITLEECYEDHEFLAGAEYYFVFNEDGTYEMRKEINDYE